MFERFSAITSAGFVDLPDFHAQPGAGVVPVPLGGGVGDVQSFRRLLDRQAREIAELDQIGLGRSWSASLRQGLVQCEQLLRRAASSTTRDSSRSTGRGPPPV